MMQPLLSIDEAAEKLGVPKGSLRSAAEAHGLLICMGRTRKISPDDLPELIEKCRNAPKAPASTGGKTSLSGSSATLDARTDRPASKIAEKLKKRSHSTLHKKTAQVVPLSRAN